jgi:transcriptional regulator with XRE-family HTH domain
MDKHESTGARTMGRGSNKITRTQISRVVREKRLAFGITQKKLGELLGYEDSMVIYMIESGRMKVPQNKLKRLAKVLFIDRHSLGEYLVMDYLKDVEKLLNVRLS